MNVLEWITDSAASLPDGLVWGLGGLFALLEAGLGLGFVFPGETIVLVLAATIDTPLSAITMGVVVTLCASAGDHVGYLLGRRFGTGLRDRRLIRRMGVANWDRAVGVLERRGALAVFLTRLVPVIRTLMPAAAGVARVPYPAFLAASLGGAATWSVLYVGAGVLVHGSIEAVQQTLGSVGWIAVAAVVLVVVVVVVARRIHRSGAVGVAFGRGLAEVTRVAGRRAVLVLAAGALVVVSREHPLTLLPAALLALVVIAGRALHAGPWARTPSDVAIARAVVVVDRLVSIALVIGLGATHLLSWPLVVAFGVPDLVILAVVLSGARPSEFERSALVWVRDALVLGVAVIASVSFSRDVGPLGLFAIVAAVIVLLGVAGTVRDLVRARPGER